MGIARCLLSLGGLLTLTERVDSVTVALLLIFLPLLLRERSQVFNVPSRDGLAESPFASNCIWTTSYRKFNTKDWILQIWS